jgi:hypothetical protein
LIAATFCSEQRSQSPHLERSRACLARQSPEFVRSGPVKGIGIVASIQNWDAASYGLTERRTAALHGAGLNTLRVFIASRV